MFRCSALEPNRWMWSSENNIVGWFRISQHPLLDFLFVEAPLPLWQTSKLLGVLKWSLTTFSWNFDSWKKYSSQAKLFPLRLFLGVAAPHLHLLLLQHDIIRCLHICLEIFQNRQIIITKNEPKRSLRLTLDVSRKKSQNVGWGRRWLWNVGLQLNTNTIR